MKIKITESQFKKIKKLNEDESQLQKFKELCVIVDNESKQILNKIINENIANIINGNIDLSLLLNKVEKNEDKIRIAEKNIGNLVDSDIIENLSENTLGRLNAISLLIYALEGLEKIGKQNIIYNNFGDFNKPDIKL